MEKKYFKKLSSLKIAFCMMETLLNRYPFCKPQAQANLLKCYRLFIAEVPSQLDLLYNETQKLPYIWAKDNPLLYAQQIIMKVGKCPKC